MLQEEISKEFKVEVSEIDKDKITKLTHYNQRKRTTLSFIYSGTIYYVCNDTIGFSIGRHQDEERKKVEHKDYKSLFKNGYECFNFAKDEVFELIIIIAPYLDK